jgi:hypothetical protein
METMKCSPKSIDCEENTMLSADQLARRWGLCRQTILKINRDALLPSVTFGSQTIRFPLGKIQEIEREIVGSNFPIMRAIRGACGRYTQGAKAEAAQGKACR